MGTAEATLKRKRAARRSKASGRRAGRRPSAAQLRDLLDRALAAVDADEKAGSLLRATGLRARLRVPDLGVTLDVEPSDEANHQVSWSFSETPGGTPKVELIMDSEAANAYLQGRESLAIAMAHNRVRYRGEARCALRYLPAMRVVVDAYRRLVREDYPELAV
jgi:hypothetical protein